MKKHIGYLITTLLLAISIRGIAQRPPNIQATSLRAPENVNTDGKTTEWKNKFAAFNNNIKLYYTLANDDAKLYLVMQATDALVIRKIIAGGITLSINQADSKNNKGGVAITYPLFNKNNWPEINLRNRPIIIKDTLIKIERIDSFMRASNWQLDNKSKEIKVIGAKGLKDTLISVYNNDDIKAVSQLDPRIAYNYELSVPLKYLNLSVNGQDTFNYKLTINGSSFAEGNTITDVKGGGTRVTATGDNKLVPIADMQYMRFPAYLVGSYTLAKGERVVAK